MDINLIKSYIVASPDILGNILNIMKYRNLRTEQAYYAKLAYQYDHLDISKQCKEVRNAGALARGYWSTKSQRLDQDRRQTHNKALISYNSILKIGEEKGLESLFNGKTLTNEEILKHERAERREEITDSMFEMLYIIEESAIEQENPELSQNLNTLKGEVRSFNRNYCVTKSLLKDESSQKDGGIEFDLSILFNNNINGNNDIL